MAETRNQATTVETPIAIAGIDHVVLRTGKLEAMLRFYRDLLGCPVEKEQPKIGLIQLRAGRCLIDIVPLDGELGRRGGAGPGAEGHNLDHFCLRIDPFDATTITAFLEAAGLEVGPVVSRYGAEGQGPSIYVQDPEGNTVELKGPADRPHAD